MTDDEINTRIKALVDPWREQALRPISSCTSEDEVTQVISARGKLVMGLLFSNGLMDGEREIATTITSALLGLGMASIVTSLAVEHYEESFANGRKIAVENTQALIELTRVPRASA